MFSLTCNYYYPGTHSGAGLFGPSGGNIQVQIGSVNATDLGVVPYRVAFVKGPFSRDRRGRVGPAPALQRTRGRDSSRG